MGEHKLSFDDVAVGDEAPVLTHKLTRTDLVKYAGASGDFNPMHHDEPMAKAAGQPSVTAISVSTRPWRRTRRSTIPGCAPIAMRMPISRVRRLTA